MSLVLQRQQNKRETGRKKLVRHILTNKGFRKVYAGLPIAALMQLIQRPIHLDMIEKVMLNKEHVKMSISIVLKEMHLEDMYLEEVMFFALVILTNVRFFAGLLQIDPHNLELSLRTILHLPSDRVHELKGGAIGMKHFTIILIRIMIILCCGYLCYQGSIGSISFVRDDNIILKTLTDMYQHTDSKCVYDPQTRLILRIVDKIPTSVFMKSENTMIKRMVSVYSCQENLRENTNIREHYTRFHKDNIFTNHFPASSERGLMIYTRNEYTEPPTEKEYDENARQELLNNPLYIKIKDIILSRSVTEQLAFFSDFDEQSTEEFIMKMVDPPVASKEKEPIFALLYEVVMEKVGNFRMNEYVLNPNEKLLHQLKYTIKQQILRNKHQFEVFELNMEAALDKISIFGQDIYQCFYSLILFAAALVSFTIDSMVLMRGNGTLLLKNVPQLSPPQLSPPQLSPPQLSPPQLAPPQLSPPQLAPPQLAPPQLSPPQLSPPQLAPRAITRKKTVSRIKPKSPAEISAIEQIKVQTRAQHRVDEILKQRIPRQKKGGSTKRKHLKTKRTLRRK